MITYRLKGEKKFFKTLNIIDDVVLKDGQSQCRNVADTIVKDIKSSWSPFSPSNAGDPPAKDIPNTTGTLDKSVRVDAQLRDPLGRFADEKNGTKAVIRFDTSGNAERERGNYAQPLELGVDSGNRGQRILPRPFVAPAVSRHAKTLRVAIKYQTLNGRKIR